MKTDCRLPGKASNRKQNRVGGWAEFLKTQEKENISKEVSGILFLQLEERNKLIEFYNIILKLFQVTLDLYL
jgi:hypothetical protein